MERITSRQNASVKRFRELAHAAVPRPAAGHPDEGAGPEFEVLLDGEHLVQEALACNLRVDIAAFSEIHLDDVRSPLAAIAIEIERRGGRVLAVTDPVLAAMSPVHQPSGVVAIARARTADTGLMMTVNQDCPLVLLLAGLQDPGNVGAIVRAAAAFGASGVIAIEGSVNPFGWKALRGAMGGTFRLPVAVRGSLAEVIASARRQGVRLIAAVPRGGTPLPDVDLRRPTAIVLGGEGAGVSDGAMAAVDEAVTIPMRTPVESLNVAVAAAVILYEASRQRQRSPTFARDERSS